MIFDEWLQIGVDNKWCGPAVCSSHDGIPMSEGEEAEWEDGSDPCHHIVRLYESEEMAEDVNRDFQPYRWR
jgi:hypothetical protein